MRIATIALASTLALSLTGSAWAQAAAGSNNSMGKTGSQQGTMNNPASVNGKSEAGSSSAGSMEKGSGKMMKGDAMEKSGAGMQKGGQTGGPAEPTPGR